RSLAPAGVSERSFSTERPVMLHAPHTNTIGVLATSSLKLAEAINVARRLPTSGNCVCGSKCVVNDWPAGMNASELSMIEGSLSLPSGWISSDTDPDTAWGWSFLIVTVTDSPMASPGHATGAAVIVVDSAGAE